MKNLSHQFLLVCAVLFALTFIADAQTQTAPANDEQPKVVKAVAANEYTIGNVKGARGYVNVHVKINSDGEVVSAIAVSGHPVLKAICVNAAKRWVFESIKDKSRERTVKLIFNFQKAEKKEDSGIFFKPPYTVEFFSEEVR